MKNKYRICWISSGYDIFDINFISALKKKGHDLVVFVLRPRILEPQEKIDNVKYISQTFETKNRIH